MGVSDRNWFREDHERRSQVYGGDFSLNSRKVKANKRSYRSYPLTYKNDKYIFMDVITIVISLALGLWLVMGSKIPEALIAIGIVSTQHLSALAFGVCALFELFLFFYASWRRKNFDNGRLNAFSMIVSMLIFVIMAVFLLFKLYNLFF